MQTLDGIAVRNAPNSTGFPQFLSSLPTSSPFPLLTQFPIPILRAQLESAALDDGLRRGM